MRRNPSPFFFKLIFGTAEQAAEELFAVEKNSRSLTSKEVRDDKNTGLSWRS
jgi:hypothetical protein